jgi:hypothetical protein
LDRAYTRNPYTEQLSPHRLVAYQGADNQAQNQRLVFVRPYTTLRNLPSALLTHPHQCIVAYHSPFQSSNIFLQESVKYMKNTKLAIIASNPTKNNPMASAPYKSQAFIIRFIPAKLHVLPSTAQNIASMIQLIIPHRPLHRFPQGVPKSHGDTNQ